jgi:adenine-specific DNA-methyltransferase
MEKLKLHSPDLTQANIDKLAQIFPNCVVEARDADGSVNRRIDFEQLRQVLSNFLVEGSQERYQLNWPGKRAAILTANAPIAKTLRPYRDESVNFETTKNLFIEGDNLEVLKLLQETYLNKVKMIYIDPPYNTGNDFVYNDDLVLDTKEYLLQSNQSDSLGNKLIANTESNGRFHSDWLSMLYPRLKLARNLLVDDGVIFCSINDVEAPRLRMILDEIFGEDNFLGQLIWMKGKEGGNDNSGFGLHHEYVICYGRNKEFSSRSIKLDPKDTSRHKTELPEENKVKVGAEIYKDGEQFQLINLSKQKDYEVKIPLRDGTLITWPSYAPQKTIDEYVRIGKIFVGAKGVPYVKSFLSDEADGSKPSTLIESEWGTTKAGGISIRELFGSSKIFSYPKPPRLIQRLISLVSSPQNSDGEVILDFFAGSSASAHATMQLNAEDSGKRKFIMVQLPEPFTRESEAYKSGFKSIAELSKERIRRAGEKIKKDHEDKYGLDNLDIGFRVLKIDTSNMKEVFYTPDAISQDLLSDQVNNIREDRTPEDLLFQVLLDWGVDLALPITKESIAGKTVYFVDGNALAACFEEGVSEEFVKLLAKREPLRVVFRDAGFASDSVKINVEQIFKLMSPATDIKTI